MKSAMPLPELFEEDELSFSFKQPRGKNDAYHLRKPPKLVHTFNRSINASMASVISFRLDDSRTELSSLYNRSHPDTYYEQCFEQLTKVGEGSFGEVFKVRSRTDGQLYAVKKSKTYFRSTHSRQVCLEEVRRYEQFSEHENCVKLYQAWEQDDRLYMQMELCRENLEVYAREQRQLPDCRIWSIMLDLLLALRSLHDRDLIHLDIKLDNILVTDDGTCKLADFGIVFDLTRGNTLYAMEGDSRYMAPELMEGHYTKAADIFSLGIATLELACNLELPSNGRVWQRLRSGQPLPDVLARRISPELRETIRRMIHPKPHKRPTVDELLRLRIIRKVYESRRRLRILEGVKKYAYRKISRLTRFFITAVLWLVACFRLQHRKLPSDGRVPKGSRKALVDINGTTFGASRSFQDQSSGLLEDEDDDVRHTFNSSACTSIGDRTGAGSSDKDGIQITPTLNNTMPPTHTPTVRIVNSTPLNHNHPQQHSVKHHHGQCGSRHASRIMCSPLRFLWLEDDPDDTAMLADLRRNPNSEASGSPGVLRHNDSDNDICPLGSISSDLNVSTQEALPSTSYEPSITSTPNCSLYRSMRGGIRAGALGTSIGSDYDSPLSSGYAAFLIKKKLQFNPEDGE